MKINRMKWWIIIFITCASCMSVALCCIKGETSQNQKSVLFIRKIHFLVNTKKPLSMDVGATRPPANVESHNVKVFSGDSFTKSEKMYRNIYYGSQLIIAKITRNDLNQLLKTSFAFGGNKSASCVEFGSKNSWQSFKTIK